MAVYQSVSTRRGSLEYMVQEGKVTVTGYSGSDLEVSVPAELDGLPVTVIAKKTFLSRKQLKRVFLPPSLEEIGDFAFTFCSNLESVWIPRNTCKVGSRIFMECKGIRKLYLYDCAEYQKENIEAPLRKTTDPEAEQKASLLAAAALLLDAEYLFRPLDAGTAEWISQWDSRMEQFMKTEDQEGYTRMILCGEEDVGSSLDLYLNKRRREKVRLAMIRLMNPLGLRPELEQEWKNYLADHTKGCTSEETWEVLLEEHSHEQEYFRLFAETGCLTEENFDAILRDMKDEHAEMKSFFIRYREEEMAPVDFFASLSLDL